MHVLVIYGSIEGQTRKIAEAVKRQVQAAGHDVRMFDTAARRTPLDCAGIDRIVLAAPVHERRHPPDFEVAVTASRAALAARPTLLISVSLKAAFADGLEEAQDYLTEMEMRTGFTPTRELLLAGAVRPASYGYFEREVVRNVALAGHPVDLVEGVREFTDWERLRTEVAAFIAAD